ncbi:MAG TPA: 3'(2'),5'-bisphosphate nucleotidase CysQ [Fluviicola sp.]|nr:3'(2'),5'-bisphosphate nucleotidase CysQ [Fluviicola sp.]
MKQRAHYDLLQVALAAVVEASAEIIRVYREGFSPNYKRDGSPVTQADLASNSVIERYLLATEIPLLTEESVHAPYEERHQWEQLWCVDPLDGTKEFIKRNDEFAINIALIEHKKPVLGIIASPVEELILVGGKEVQPAVIPFTGISDRAAWQLIGRKTEINSPIVIASSRTPHSGATLDYIRKTNAEFGAHTFLKKGSALKFFDLALGKADVYPRFAPTMEWDIAAGQAIMESLGGSVYHAISGEPLHYNKANLLNPYFVVNSHAVNQYFERNAQ